MDGTNDVSKIYNSFEKSSSGFMSKIGIFVIKRSFKKLNFEVYEFQNRIIDFPSLCDAKKN